LPTSSYAIINPLEMPSLKVHTCGEGAWNEENGDDKVHQMSNDLEWGKMTNIWWLKDNYKWLLCLQNVLKPRITILHSKVIFVCGTIVLENKYSSVCYYNLKERERKDLSTWFSDNWILDALA
jgi:hypothetical protein